MEKIDSIKNKLEHYTCHKVVKATPMTEAEYHELRGYEAPSGDRKGYFVMYDPDDYISWSPKDVFEAGYNKSETFVDRLKMEIDDLRYKIKKLDQFITDRRFDGKEIPQEHLLVIQLSIMKSYCNVLDIRYDLLKERKSESKLPG